MEYQIGGWLSMQKNDLIHNNDTIFRILAINDSEALVMDCLKRNMPLWCNIASIESFAPCTEQEQAEQTDVELFDIESLDAAKRKIVHDRYTIIAGVLPFISDDKMRNLVITRIADEHEICKQTVRNYLCLYLAYQDISALAPKRNKEDTPLTKDE